MKYNTYIFDLDGTLLSTLGDLAASCNYALRSCGMPERSLDEVRQFVGNGVKMLMIRAVPGGEENADFEKAYATFREHYSYLNIVTKEMSNKLLRSCIKLIAYNCQLRPTLA